MQVSDRKLKLNVFDYSFGNNYHLDYIIADHCICWDPVTNYLSVKFITKNAPYLRIYFATKGEFINATTLEKTKTLPDEYALIKGGDIFNNIFLDDNMIIGTIFETDCIAFHLNNVCIASIMISDLWIHIPKDMIELDTVLGLVSRTRQLKPKFDIKLKQLELNRIIHLKKISEINSTEPSYHTVTIQSRNHRIKIYLVLCMHLLDRSPLLPQCFCIDILTMDDFDIKFITKFLEFAYIDPHIPTSTELKIDGCEYPQIISEMFRIADFLGFQIYVDFFAEIKIILI